MHFTKDVRDVIHGYIGLTEVERAVIDTLEFQRLRRIKQLAFTHYVYPNAVHTRFIHSLGTMHVAGKFAERMFPEDEERVQKIRLAALLHDVGHGPYSHTFEAFTRKIGVTHEDIGRKIIESSSIADVLKDFGYDPKEIADIAFGRAGLNSQFIYGSVDADKLDFVPRDAYFTGAEYSSVDIDRLIKKSRVVGDRIVFQVPAALSSLEAFVIARYEMFRAVYFHKTVRAADIMFVKALEPYENELLDKVKNVEEYVLMDDSYADMLIAKVAKEEDGFHGDLARRLLRRDLLKLAFEKMLHTEIRIERITSPEALAQEIASHAGVDEKFVFVDIASVPAVPYVDSTRRYLDIPVIDSDGNIGMLSQYSKVVETLRRYMEILRVYTLPQYLDKVREACRKVLREVYEMNM